jgi:hypothetical protein
MTTELNHQARHAMASPLRSARLERKVQRLAAVAQSLTQGRAVAGLCRKVLAAGDGGQHVLPDASRLNNDGNPLQLCLSSGARGTVLKIIGDPGAQLPELESRYRSTRAAVRTCLKDAGAGSLLALAERTLDCVLPDSAQARAAYRHGFAWIGVSPDQPGAAFYAEMAPLGQHGGWDRASTWLAGILPDDRAAQAAIAALRAHCVVASAGLEGSTPQDARAKIYFRLSTPMALAALGIELLATPEVRDFLTIAMAQFAIDRDGLVLSIGFSLASGAVADVKVDLCGHCLRHDGAGWSALLARLAARFALARAPLDALLADGACAVAFVGFGLDAKLSPRLNVYLNAATPHTPPARAALAAAGDDGVAYLCRLQHQDGHWNDYRLPVGASDQWVSAYVGLALARYGAARGHGPALTAARRAAAWLLAARADAPGWGYNAGTGADADSTALALALLRALGLPNAPADQQLLRRHWRGAEAGGGAGVATYEGPDAWGRAHWCVTPLAYLGMAPDQQRALRTGFLDGLRSNRMADGQWRSYWWRNPYYSTFGTLEALNQLGIEEAQPMAAPAAAIVVDNPFDLACLLGSELLRGRAPDQFGKQLRTLLAWQHNDGRWPGHANLRVTDQHCPAPWDEPSGAYYADHAGTLSTATVLRMLALATQPPARFARAAAAPPQAAPETVS